MKKGLIQVQAGHFQNESVWLAPVNVLDGLYRIANIPFFAYNVTLDDVVQAHPADDVELCRVSAVVERSRRVAVGLYPSESASPEQVQALLHSFVERRFPCEGFAGGPYAVAVLVDQSPELQPLLKAAYPAVIQAYGILSDPNSPVPCSDFTRLLPLSTDDSE